MDGSFWGEMNTDPDVARLASLLVEPARAAMLMHLLDGRSWTAAELANVAGVRPPSASAHLKKLLAGELIKVSPAGRHRYYRLAGAEVASLLEQFARSAPGAAVSTPGERRASSSMRECRLCYNHLAGRLGVEIAETLVRREWLIEDEPWYRLTEAGWQKLTAIGIKPATGKTCMDWSERRLHIAGILGRNLVESLLNRKVLQRDPKSRALRVTPEGVDVIRTDFGVDWPLSSVRSLPGALPARAGS